MIRRPPRSTPFPTRRSSDLGIPQGGLLITSFMLQLRCGQSTRAEIRFIPSHEREAPPPTHGWSSVRATRSEEHTSELQSPCNLVCRLLLEKKKTLHKISSPV